MTEAIDPIRALEAERRRKARRRNDPSPPGESPAEAATTFPVIGHTAPPKAPEKAPGDSVFNAQVMGQGGQKRGLRGGPPVLQQARTAYLEAEWSGPGDRRPPRGTVSQTKI